MPYAIIGIVNMTIEVGISPTEIVISIKFVIINEIKKVT